MRAVVVDTNVILVANDRHAEVSRRCVVTCAERLKAIVDQGRVVIDDAFEILSEYQNKTEPYVGKRPGDAFLKWLLQNKSNTRRCDQVSLKEHAQRGFESFPEDNRLRTFDPSDRKFVAVASAHPDRPPILQAADSKWLAWQEALIDHGLAVEFLCRADIKAFDERNSVRKRARKEAR